MRGRGAKKLIFVCVCGFASCASSRACAPSALAFGKKGATRMGVRFPSCLCMSASPSRARVNSLLRSPRRTRYLSIAAPLPSARTCARTFHPASPTSWCCVASASRRIPRIFGLKCSSSASNAILNCSYMSLASLVSSGGTPLGASSTSADRWAKTLMSST